MSSLLPLADPMQIPVGRDLLPSERREFVRTHRTCVFGYGRKNDGPAMSVVYYVPTADDELLISTMRNRGKEKAVLRNAKVSLCALDEQWPFSYLQVYCNAIVDDDRELAIDVGMAVGWRMSGEELPAEARPVVRSLVEEEDRVVLRCRPYATFATPPRHLHSNDQDEKLTHWLSSSMPWDAPDTPLTDSHPRPVHDVRRP